MVVVELLLGHIRPEHQDAHALALRAGINSMYEQVCDDAAKYVACCEVMMRSIGNKHAIIYMDHQ